MLEDGDGRLKRVAAAYLLFALVLISCAAGRLTSFQFSYEQPDELIAVKVTERVVAEASLDTNWEKAALPDMFKHPQYNFSGYLLSAAGILKLARATQLSQLLSTLGILRWWSGLLGIIALILTFLVGKRLFGLTAGSCAGVLASLNPLLYQDSLYARPEAFLTVLTLLYLYVLGSFVRESSKPVFFASFVLGIMVATKISAVVLLPLLFLPSERQSSGDHASKSFRASLQEYGTHAIVCISRRIKTVPFGLALGFAIAAPYALVHLDKFVSGIRTLQNQYMGEHWPHGLGDGSFLERLVYAANYFFPTSGWLLFLFSIFGAWCAVKGRAFTTSIAFFLCLLFAIRFSSYPVFFERNFSHVVPVFLIFAAHGLVRAASILSPRPAARWVALVSLLALCAASEARTTYTLRFYVLPGIDAEYLAHLRDDIQSELGIASTNVGWIRDYSHIKQRVDDECRPTLIEFPYPGDRDSIKVVERLKERDGFIEVGRFTSPFSNVSPSTLHVYFRPSALFLFRDTNFRACENTGKAFVTKRAVGDRLEIRSINAEPAWTRSGSYDGVPGPFGSKDYYGSWSGSDAHVGKLRVIASTRAEKFIVLPYLTGPVSTGQSIELSDAVSGRVFWRRAPVEPSPAWAFMLIPVPPGTTQVLVQAADEGPQWGEWLAVEWPRAIKRE
jgi:hypothetical protein